MADEKTVCIVTQNTHVQSFYHIFDSILLINHKLICFTFKNKMCWVCCQISLWSYLLVTKDITYSTLWVCHTYFYYTH